MRVGWRNPGGVLQRRMAGLEGTNLERVALGKRAGRIGPFKYRL
jgi:hypothetical protein